MTPDEAKRIAEEYARSVPDAIHVPALARMIEKYGTKILDEKETRASAPLKLTKDARAARS